MSDVQILIAAMGVLVLVSTAILGHGIDKLSKQLKSQGLSAEFSEALQKRIARLNELSK